MNSIAVQDRQARSSPIVASPRACTSRGCTRTRTDPAADPIEHEPVERREQRGARLEATSMELRRAASDRPATPPPRLPRSPRPPTRRPTSIGSTGCSAAFAPRDPEGPESALALARAPHRRRTVRRPRRDRPARRDRTRRPLPSRPETATSPHPTRISSICGRVAVVRPPGRWPRHLARVGDLALRAAGPRRAGDRAPPDGSGRSPPSHSRWSRVTAGHCPHHRPVAAADPSIEPVEARPLEDGRGRPRSAARGRRAGRASRAGSTGCGRRSARPPPWDRCSRA